MTLRRRLMALSAVVVGSTLVIASLVAYLALRGELRGQVDDALRDQARLATRIPVPPPGAEPFTVEVPELSPARGAPRAIVQVVRPDGSVVRQGTDILLPATGGAPEGDVRLRDAEVDGVHLRVADVGLPGGGILQLGRSLEGVDETLSRLRLAFLALCLAGVGVALAGTRLLTRRVITPMSEELAASVVAQRRLVADASHELRTPVTALRTNAELLRDARGLDDDERRQIADDVVAQAEELSLLVGDVVELARGDAREPEREEVRLDELVREAVVRAQRHAPGRIRFTLDADAVVVSGAPERLARAVNNLLDNAANYSPPGGEVEVRVFGRELTVRDHGPGIDPSEARAVFDRFRRGAAAASTGRAGSGLGLAIVRQVADAHGASVALEPAPGGGTLARLRFAPEA